MFRSHQLYSTPANVTRKFLSNNNRLTTAIPTILTDGLILSLDAGNTSSYPGSGNSWFNLVGRNWSAGWSGSFVNSSNSFDGNTNTYSGSAGGTFSATYTFSGGLNVSGSVRVFVVFGASAGQVGSTTNVILIDGNDITSKMISAGVYLTGGWIDVTSEVGSVFNTIVLNGTSGSTNPGIAAIEIGGTILVNSPNGTLVNGPTYTSSNGGSLVFDGVDDYVSISSPPVDIIEWYSNTNYTLDYFLYADSFGSSLNGYTNVLGHSSTSDGSEYWSFGPRSNGRVVFYYWSGAQNFFETTTALSIATWYHLAFVKSSSSLKIYINGVESASSTLSVSPQSSSSFPFLIGKNTGASSFSGNISNLRIYKGKALTAAEIQQNYDALKERFISSASYENVTYSVSGNLTITGNATNNVSIFKTSGTTSWDNQAYSNTGFTAPCTIEFRKQAGTTDNGSSYAMIGWNEDPTTDASYTSLDHASYPYRTNNYEVYNNGSQTQSGGTWSTSNKFYIVYGTDGFIRHYNGSTLLYSVNYGIGKTVYVDSSFYSPNGTFGGFSNIRVIKRAWNGTSY